VGHLQAVVPAAARVQGQAGRDQGAREQRRPRDPLPQGARRAAGQARPHRHRVNGLVSGTLPPRRLSRERPSPPPLPPPPLPPSVFSLARHFSRCLCLVQQRLCRVTVVPFHRCRQKTEELKEFNSNDVNATAYATVLMAAGLHFFVPFHTNWSQLENAAPFLRTFGGTIFLYDWNPDKYKMRHYFENIVNWPLVSVRPFSLDNVVRAIEECTPKRVVVLLTASSNYAFANQQRDFFGALQKAFPYRIVDQGFCVGHCMYGCQSCGPRPHAHIPRFCRFCLSARRKDFANTTFR